jgi:hypothetical protein
VVAGVIVRSPITTFAPLSSIWYPASTGVSAGFTGVTQAPKCQAANKVTTSSIRFGSTTATMSPGPTPRAASVPAAARTAPANPALSRAWASSAIQAPPGSRSARSAGSPASRVCIDMLVRIGRRV